MIELLFVIFCGLALGSFVTLASWRLPRDEDIVVKPSRCPACETPLGFKDLWPVLSWLASRGTCRHCKTKVSVRYPVTELVTAIVCVALYARYGLSLQCLLLVLMAVALLIMIVADFEQFIIPDQVHVALLPLGLIYHFVIGTPMERVAFGFVIGMGLGLLLHHGYRLLRKKEGLGYGDVKFLAVAGLWLTPYPFVPFLFYSGMFGIATGLVWRALGKGQVFPFGPALAMALFLCVAYPEFPQWFWSVGGLLE